MFILVNMFIGLKIAVFIQCEIQCLNFAENLISKSAVRTFFLAFHIYMMPLQTFPYSLYFPLSIYPVAIIVLLNPFGGSTIAGCVNVAAWTLFWNVALYLGGIINTALTA